MVWCSENYKLFRLPKQNSFVINFLFFFFFSADPSLMCSFICKLGLLESFLSFYFCLTQLHQSSDSVFQKYKNQVNFFYILTKYNHRLHYFFCCLGFYVKDLNKTVNYKSRQRTQNSASMTLSNFLYLSN